MHVAVINYVSEAYDMLKLSTDSVFYNAGTDDFTYIIVTWNPSESVLSYINSLGTSVVQVEYQYNASVGYVPNLRNMINVGFDAGFSRCDFCTIVNTDVFCGENWLKNLAKYATVDTIVNSIQICSTTDIGLAYIKDDLWMPTYNTFNFDKFNVLYNLYYKDTLITEKEKYGWRSVCAMPYMFHKKWWKLCGPWEINMKNALVMPPDLQFFRRCHKSGALFTVSCGSVAYHHNAGERTFARPAWSLKMKNDLYY